MIKGKSPYPFQTIALAISFSPGLPFLVSEMEKLCLLNNAMAVFIHIGKKTGEKQRELSTLLINHGFNDSNSRIYWEQGEIVPALLRICKHEVVDLILLGASEKSDFQKPVGTVVKDIASQAKCTLLFYSSCTSFGNFKNIVVEGGDHPKTELTIQTAVYFGDLVKAQSISVIDDGESSIYAKSYLKYSNKTSLAEPSTQTISPENTLVSVNHVSLKDSNCSDFADYCFRNNVDLMITRSNEHRLRIFDRVSVENDIDAFLDKLPCSLMIVHSRPVG